MHGKVPMYLIPCICKHMVYSSKFKAIVSYAAKCTITPPIVGNNGKHVVLSVSSYTNKQMSWTITLSHYGEYVFIVSETHKMTQYLQCRKRE